VNKNVFSERLKERSSYRIASYSWCVVTISLERLKERSSYRIASYSWCVVTISPCCRLAPYPRPPPWQIWTWSGVRMWSHCQKTCR